MEAGKSLPYGITEEGTAEEGILLVNTTYGSRRLIEDAVSVCS